MDYLVNLSPFDPTRNSTRGSQGAGVIVRRALAPELDLVTAMGRAKRSRRLGERDGGRLCAAAAVLLPRDKGRKG